MEPLDPCDPIRLVAQKIDISYPHKFGKEPIMIFPCVILMELADQKYYIMLTTNFNYAMSKMSQGYGPIFTRLHNFKKILFIEPFGDFNCLKHITLKTIQKYGYQNVRSSLPGHSSRNVNEPTIYKKFKEIQSASTPSTQCQTTYKLKRKFKDI